MVPTNFYSSLKGQNTCLYFYILYTDRLSTRYDKIMVYLDVILHWVFHYKERSINFNK